jgi:hypothetical protein
VKIYQSQVPDHEGRCAATWLQGNRLINRIDGGVTGFFRQAKRGWFGFWYRTGPEFHGLLSWDGVVRSTEGRTD